MKKTIYILCTLFLGMMAVSCTQDIDIDSSKGYLTLNISSLVSTKDPSTTRAAAPQGYDAKALHVEIQDAYGKVIKSTDNYATDSEFQGNIELMAGPYTIVAHSAKWDGNGSGFDTPYYYGSTKINVVPKGLVKASITCTLANVKLSVNYDSNFISSFKSAITTIKSAISGIAPLEFIMNQTTKSGYIPAGDFSATLAVVNNNDASNSMTINFNDAKARDHYILNFKLAETGDLGDGTEPGLKVEVDESTNTYSYTFEVPQKSAIALVTRQANAWGNFAMLSASVTAKTESFKNSGLEIQWRKAGTETWSVIPNEDLDIDAETNVTTTLKGLTPKTSYEYRLRYVDGDNEVVCDPVKFTTEDQIALYNGGFEHWHQDGAPWYPNESGVSYWDTSNPGSTTIGASYNVTTSTESPKHGGSKAAKLESKKVIIKFAAASMYTGVFGKTIGTSGAWLNWGTPFACRPTALKGYMQYHPKAIDNAGKGLPSGAPGKGDQDMCSIYIALLTESIRVDNTDMSTFPDWNTDSRVIAYGALPDAQCGATGDNWKEVNIPLVYKDITKKPTHLLVVFSSSKYGDYFHGGAGSTLYVDDFSLEYGDEPAIK